TTGEGEHVTAGRVDYLTTTGRMRAAAGDGVPLRLNSATMGELTGDALVIDPAAATGRVDGAGSLVTAATEPQDLPLHVTWRERLDLAFLVEPRDDGPDELVAIRTATFRGDAAVEHPDFHLTSDTLTAHADRT